MKEDQLQVRQKNLKIYCINIFNILFIAVKNLDDTGEKGICNVTD